MPTLSRWFIRTALIYLVVALGLGAAMYSATLTARMPALGVIWPAYLHLLTVGWVTGLIIGVAYWLFPRPDRTQSSPPAFVGWAAYILLNTGLLLRVIAEPATALDRSTPLRWLLPLSGVLQVGGASAFVALVWPRVRAR